MNNLQELLVQLDKNEIIENGKPTGMVSKEFAGLLLQELEIKMLNNVSHTRSRTITCSTSENEATIIGVAEKGVEVISDISA